MTQQFLTESFSGTAVSSMTWQAGNPRGQSVPGLTAASANVHGSLPACSDVEKGDMKPDVTGEGVFRFTGKSPSSSGFLVMGTAKSAPNSGLRCEFDLYMYAAQPVTTGSSGTGAADGISFYVLDGDQPFQAGEPGGSLGYRNLNGAYVGVGFDQVGNFSTQTAGRGGPGRSPNTVAIRCAQATGYAYLAGTALDPEKQPLGAERATERDSARRHVIIDLTPDGAMTVSIDWLAGKGPQPTVSADLSELPDQGMLPKSIKFGWAASTGDVASVHEISGFTASALDNARS